MIKMQKIVFFFLIFCLFSSQVFATQDQHESQITIQNLLNKLPAQDAVEAELINGALLQFGSAGIQKICNLLDSKEGGVKAQFALNGLAKYVSKLDLETSRLLFSNSIMEVLEKSVDYKIKSFLMSQLQIAGKDETVETLGNYLAAEKLYKPAVQVLVAIGSEKAKQKILSELKKENPLNQITLMKALGELRCEKAIPLFVKSAQSKNKTIRLTALFALANTGAQEAKELFVRALQQESGIIQTEIYSYYHLLARRLFEHSDKNSGIDICKILVNSATGEEVKSAALSSLVEFKGAVAIDDLLRAFDTENETLHGTAIQLSAKILGADATKKWTDKIAHVSGSAQIKIISMLGDRGDKTALPKLYQLLHSQNKSNRIAAIAAVAKLDQEKAIPQLIQLLTKTEDSEEIAQVKRALFQFSTKDLVNPIAKNLEKVTPPSQIALLEILVQRNPQVKTKPIFKLISNGDQKVRIEAIKALGNLATEKDFNKLVKLLLALESRTEQKQFQRTIAACINKSKNPDKLTNELIKKYKKLKADKKITILQTLCRVDNKLALETITKETRNGDSKIKDVAIRVLSNCNNPIAVAPLLQIIKTTENESHQILAIRGCIRIIGMSDFPDKKKIRILENLIHQAKRQEEKKLALAALGEIKTIGSLKVVRNYLNDYLLKTEAAIATVKIVVPERNRKNNFSGPEIAIALMNGDPALQNLIENQYSEFSGLNQPPRGFTQLFNGKDLNNWKGLVENPIKRAQMSKEELAAAQIVADENMYEHWRVEDGILMFDGKGHSLCTAKDYENFEMLVDWKIQKGGDSGIYLKGSPQVQIWDPAQWPEGSGGLYNNQKGPRKPLEAADNPIGEWNTFRIKMIKDRVTVFLNDVLVVDNVVMENYWERDKQIYPIGQIELQAHSTPLYFKNVYIRELPRKKQLFSGKLFNGKDLTGWKIIGGKDGSWKVENNVLFTDGDGGGWLSTEKEFTNFLLELEFRVPEGGNSGVMIRAPQYGNPSYTGMEIQVLDDYAAQYAKLKPWQYTGSVYAVEPASKRVTKKANQWQKMKIRCEGPMIQVVLNGVQIVDTNLISHMDKEAGHPGIKRRKGHIGLQNHSTKIEYRNIKITELDLN